MRQLNGPIVIGAGLVGSFWALVLQQLGFSPRVYERRDRGGDGLGRSVNLVITARGTNALEKIGLWKEIRPLTTPVYGRMIHDLQGELTYQPYGRSKEECNYSISRKELNQFLCTLVESRGIPLHFEHTLTRIDMANGKAIFHNGVSLTFERLFATDGAGSAARQSLQEQLPSMREECSPFPVGYKEMLMSARQDGEYPIDETALHIWPRGQEMLMGLPNRDGSFTMTLFMPKRQFALLDTPSKLREHFRCQYPDVIPLIPHYLDQYMANPLGSFSTVHLSPWIYEDRVCLLGDAAHAIVPFFGQGLNCGLEDCAVLYDLWHRHHNWPKVLTQFDQIQRPNGEAIATMAIENYREMAERVGNERFLLRKQIEHKIEAHFPQLYRSRYGMVIYTLIPYRLAQAAGEIQEEILEELLQDTGHIEELDLARAKVLIEDKLTPFLHGNKIYLD